jgi:GTP cyclohydrolase I
MDLPDIHDTAPKVPIKIKCVGVDNVKLPFRLEMRDGSPIQIVGDVEMLCSLDETRRGISMSRFLRTLQPHLMRPIKRTVLIEILYGFLNKLETEEASIKFKFLMPLQTDSPISNNSFPQYYNCAFKGDYKNGIYNFYESVRVQYSAYCPCSAALCKINKGYPHNQRAFADVIVKTFDGTRVWLEDIIDMVVTAVDTIPYPIVQRPDEAFIAEMARMYPQFVEDSVRSISMQLEHYVKIADWFVKCTHEESIHTSNAIAINWKGVEGGFNENTYI